MSALAAGTRAPDFSLADQRERRVQLSSMLGRPLVLYFYPKAMTPGCTIQARDLQAASMELDARGALVFGISPDAPRRLAKFAERDGLSFGLLADEDHAVAESYGVWGPKKFMGREYQGIIRTTFIIDGEGSIASVLSGFKVAEHCRLVLDALAQLEGA